MMKFVAFAILAAATAPTLVYASVNDCKKKYGPAPPPCSSPPAGKPYPPPDPDLLNTQGNAAPDPDISPLYDPLKDSFCFNEDYAAPSPDQLSMYNDYKTIFEWGFRNQMGSPLQQTSSSATSLGVTANRFPSMYLRMCFHDNSVDPAFPDPQDYIKASFDQNTFKWTGKGHFLDTSGADASQLICPEERLHPNNNYDQTASRVLYTMQSDKILPGSVSLKNKYGLSYADLLHNGCLAATIYLTGIDPSQTLAYNPMQFGRNDACYVDYQCKRRKALCGPTHLLPGVKLSVTQTNNWFKSRGMKECQWMSLLWTHTVLDNMGFECPLKKLTCTPTANDASSFKSQSLRYFNAGDKLDYFDFFLEPGEHKNDTTTSDPNEKGCDWHVDYHQKPWPLTEIDCTLGLDNVKKAGETILATAIQNFNTPGYNTVDMLICSLNVLGGRGGVEGGTCNRINPPECKTSTNHKFGGFFGGVIGAKGPVWKDFIDPRCFQYGYGYRRSLKLVDTQDLTEKHNACLDAAYDMFLVVEGAHFAGLGIPTNTTTECPSVVFHTIGDPQGKSPMEKVSMVIDDSELVNVPEEAKLHLGTQRLSLIIDAFDNADIGKNGQKFYDPITNNCVVLLRNMADPLEIAIDDRMVNFVSRRLLQKSANHIFDQIHQSPSYKMLLLEGGSRFLKGVNKEDLLAKLIKMYV